MSSEWESPTLQSVGRRLPDRVHHLLMALRERAKKTKKTAERPVCQPNHRTYQAKPARNHGRPARNRQNQARIVKTDVVSTWGNQNIWWTRVLVTSSLVASSSRPFKSKLYVPAVAPAAPRSFWSNYDIWSNLNHIHHLSSQRQNAAGPKGPAGLDAQTVYRRSSLHGRRWWPTWIMWAWRRNWHTTPTRLETRSGTNSRNTTYTSGNTNRFINRLKKGRNGGIRGGNSCKSTATPLILLLPGVQEKVLNFEKGNHEEHRGSSRFE